MSHPLPHPPLRPRRLEKHPAELTVWLLDGFRGLPAIHIQLENPQSQDMLIYAVVGHLRLTS